MLSYKLLCRVGKSHWFLPIRQGCLIRHNKGGEIVHVGCNNGPRHSIEDVARCNIRAEVKTERLQRGCIWGCAEEAEGADACAIIFEQQL